MMMRSTKGAGRANSAGIVGRPNRISRRSSAVDQSERRFGGRISRDEGGPLA